MKNEVFSDRLQNKIDRSNSIIVAGIDPRLESMPQVFLDRANRARQNNQDFPYHAIVEFYGEALTLISRNIAAIKPNLAFFEQFGIAGLRALDDVIKIARDLDLLIIADAKRGDIGSTARAYSNAFLGGSTWQGQNHRIFDVDAVTVSPFLGKDSLEPFLRDCVDYGKGIFVLVRTSNPDAVFLQSAKCVSGASVSEEVAGWLNQFSDTLIGKCGLSGVGAVVGATAPDEAIKLRKLMPTCFFLVPGMGSQGGSAQEAVAGCDSNGRGVTINLSRALFCDFSNKELSLEQCRHELTQKLAGFNSEITKALDRT
ncbi:MAG: orotidine-5'-phosphate decarboxylase [Bdellovibrionales bacterium]|nr:orotidine-5'-phosphate decarboxylase [Bdellovibrionales bacterium]